MINNALLISFWKRKKNKASPRPLAAPASRALLLTSRAVLPRPSPRLSPFAASTPSPSPAHLSHQAQLDRVTKLQEVARAEKEKRKTQALGPGMESLSPAPGPAVGPSACPRGRPPQSACKATYDAAHAALPRARVLVLDTETSGLAGCVLDLGWVLADSDGKELAAYSKLWLLPPRRADPLWRLSGARHLGGGGAARRRCTNARATGVCFARGGCARCR